MAEMKRNSFKKLEEEQIQEYLEQRPGVPPKIEMGVMGSVRTVGFLGNILELYLPRVFELFISLVGGRREEEEGGGDGDFTSGDQKPD